MSAEAMTPRERMAAYLGGEAVDRHPCVPLVLNHAARVAGMKVSEHNRSGEAMGRAHVAAFRRYRQDMITIFTDTALLAEAMGTEMYYPEDDAARVERPAVTTAEEAARLRAPDPWTAGRLPVHLEAVRLANAEVGEEVFVGCCYALPFTTAAALLGTDHFVKALRKAPELAHQLLRVSQEAGLALTEAVIEAGGIPVLVDPVASCSMISPRQYEEFAAPYTRPLVERIKAAGLPAVLHICGRSDLIWGQMADSEADVLSLDKVDLAQAKRAVGERVGLMGNVAPAETLLYGNPPSVAEETRACLRSAGDNPRGFIVASGCEVPLATPPENVEAMLEAVREWGPPRLH